MLFYVITMVITPFPSLTPLHPLMLLPQRVFLTHLSRHQSATFFTYTSKELIDAADESHTTSGYC